MGRGLGSGIQKEVRQLIRLKQTYQEVPAPSRSSFRVFLPSLSSPRYRVVWYLSQFWGRALVPGCPRSGSFVSSASVPRSTRIVRPREPMVSFGLKPVSGQ